MTKFTQITKNKIIWLVIFSALIKFIYILTLNNQPSVFQSVNDVGYDIAKNLLEGKGYFMFYHLKTPLYSFRPPLYPLFLLGIFRLVGENPLAVRLIYLVLNTLTPFLAYKIALRIFNKETGITALIILLFYPPLIYLSGWLGPETGVIFLATFLILLLNEYKIRPGILKTLFLGLITSLAVYWRCFFLGIIPFITLAFFVFSKEKRVQRSVQFITVIFIVLLPWVIRNYSIHKKLVFITDTGMAFYIANNPDVITKGHSDFYFGPIVTDSQDMSETESSAYLFKKGGEFVRHSPREYLKLVKLRFLRLWRPYFEIIQPSVFTKNQQLLMISSETPLLLFFFLGLLLSIKKRAELFPMYMIFLYFTIVGSLIRVKVSYRMTFSPLIIIIASYAFMRIFRCIWKPKHVSA